MMVHISSCSTQPAGTTERTDDSHLLLLSRQGTPLLKVYSGGERQCVEEAHEHLVNVVGVLGLGSTKH